MSTLHIERSFDLTDAQREVMVSTWLKSAEKDWGLQCERHQEPDGDRVSLSRTGVNGELRVTGTGLTLDLTLGMLISGMAPMIQAKIESQLDALTTKLQALGPEGNSADA